MAKTQEFYVYVLFSSKAGIYYKGSTHNLEERIKKHNAGKVRSTKAYRPWKLIYFEKFYTRSEAFKREMFFKSPPGHFWRKQNRIIK